MLHQFLQTIQTGEVQSLSEIARKMKISANMVLQIAQDLTNKGYLEEIKADCSEPQVGCSDCPAHSGCQVVTRSWMLTEKGKSAASSRSPS